MRWSELPLGELPIDIIDGDRGKNYPKQNEFQEEGYCVFLSATNVTKSGFKFDAIQFIDEQKDRALRKGKLSRNDVVLTTRGTIGNSAFFNESIPYENMRINSGMVILRVVPDKFYAPFLYSYLRSQSFLKKVDSIRSGAAQPQLPIRDLVTVKIPCPDISEQIRASKFISNYDDLIENNRRRIQLLEESARLLYQEWFVHLRFPGYEQVKIIDGVPEGWDKTTADKVMDVLSGGTPKTKVPEFWDGEIPFFTPKDAKGLFTYDTEKTITDLGLSKCNSRLYPKYTVFITARGTVGKLSFAQRPMAMNQSCYALIAKGEISQEFLYSSIKASIEQFKARASGAVFDAIVVDTFKNIPFLIPSSSLCDEFTEQVKGVYSQIDNLSIQNMKLAQARDLLLPKLMSGELTV